MLARSSILAVLLALATAPAAHAKQCGFRSGEQESFGVSYVTSIEVARVTCATGKKLVRAYHSCRKARGGIRGRCPRVQGWSCSERRETIPTQFSSRATCKKGRRRVTQTYSQFT